MAIQTYITPTEANAGFPGDADYTDTQKTNSLALAFGLVNSNINSKLNVPVVGKWDGETTINVPHSLKHAQSLFYRYLLVLSNNPGWTEELSLLFEAALEFTKSITENELSVPSAQTYAHDAGWKIVGVTRASDIGSVQVRGSAPTKRGHYKIVITTPAGAVYVNAGTATFDAFRADTSAARVSAQVLDYDWKTVDSAFEIRFDGRWTDADEILISGIPATEIDTASKPDNTLRSSPIAYGG